MHPQKRRRVNALTDTDMPARSAAFFHTWTPEDLQLPKQTAGSNQHGKKKDMDRIWPDTLWGASHTRTHTRWSLPVGVWGYLVEARRGFLNFMPSWHHFVFTFIQLQATVSLHAACMHREGWGEISLSVYGLLLCFLQPCVVCWCKRSLIEMIKEKTTWCAYNHPPSFQLRVARVVHPREFQARSQLFWQS